MKTRHIAAAGLLACATGAASAGTNLVSNGDFSTDLTGWTQMGDPLLSQVLAGVFAAGGNSDGSLSQLLPTTAGTTYGISFDIMGDVAASTPGASHFTAYLGETRIYNALDGIADTRAIAVQTATSDATLLKFTYRNDSDWYFLRNVEVVAVPEPGISATLVVGLMLLGFTGMRKARQ